MRPLEPAQLQMPAYSGISPSRLRHSHGRTQLFGAAAGWHPNGERQAVLRCRRCPWCSRGSRSTAAGSSAAERSQRESDGAPADDRPAEEPSRLPISMRPPAPAAHRAGNLQDDCENSDADQGLDQACGCSWRHVSAQVEVTNRELRPGQWARSVILGPAALVVEVERSPY
jgi:hypothetical protein